MRAWGEKVLVGVVLNAAMAQNDFKAALEGLVAGADLRSNEREAVLWLLGTLEPVRPTPVNGGPALPAANDRAANQAG
jgi:hypothetical protein